jgi:hypothetical protein
MMSSFTFGTKSTFRKGGAKQKCYQYIYMVLSTSMIMTNGDTRLDRITTMNRGGKKSKRRRTGRQSSKRMRKSRKARGGTLDTSGYILAGFMTTNHPYSEHHMERLKTLNELNKIPIFLRTEKTPRSTISESFFINHTPFNINYFFLQVLYKLNYRGLNFANETGAKNYFVDEMDRPMASYYRNWSNMGLPNYLTEKEGPFWQENKNNIREIELKYPGLFERMFVTEEEERQALEEMQRKEQQQISEPRTQTYSPTTSELSDEEKQKVYQSEIEATSEMIPYLKEDLKKKKASKIGKSKYYNNLFM